MQEQPTPEKILQTGTWRSGPRKHSWALSRWVSSRAFPRPWTIRCDQQKPRPALSFGARLSRAACGTGLDGDCNQV